MVAVLALSQTACKKEIKIEINIEIKVGGVKAPLLDTTDTDSGVDKGAAMQSISSASCADYAYIADADKFYFSPDSDYVPKATLTIVTDTGTTSSLQFDLVRDSALSAQYTPAGSTTAVHAYVAKNCQQVKDFALAAIGQANSTVTITAQTKVRFVTTAAPRAAMPSTVGRTPQVRSKRLVLPPTSAKVLPAVMIVQVGGAQSRSRIGNESWSRMRYRVLLASVVIAAGLADVSVVGEPSGPSTRDVLHRLSGAARAYRERMTDIPLRETVTQTQYDSTGKLVERREQTNEYFFLGLDPATGEVLEFRRGDAASEQTPGGVQIIGLGLTGLLRIFEPDVQPQYNFHVLEVPNNPRSQLILAFEPKTWNAPQVAGSLSNLRLSGRIKGTVTVDGDSFLSLNSELLGLPAERRHWFRKFTLYKLAIDVKFQKVARVGWPEPVVVPESVRVTADSSEGKVVVLHRYQVLRREP